MRPGTLVLLLLATDAGVLMYGPRHPAETIAARRLTPAPPQPLPYSRGAVDAARITRLDSLVALGWEAYDSLVAEAVPRMAAVELRGPTVVAFYPEPPLLVWPPWPVAPQSRIRAFQERFEEYQATAAARGFEFTERYSRGLLIADRPRGWTQQLELFWDRVGFVLVAPGRPPRVHYGTLPPDVLAQALTAYAHDEHQSVIVPVARSAERPLPARGPARTPS